MKIAFLTDQLLYVHKNITGSIVQIYNLARLLADHGNDISILYSGEKCAKKLKEYENICLVHCPMSGKTSIWFKTVRTYRLALQKVHPDVVYTRGRSTLLYVASKWSRRNSKKHIWATNGEDSCEKWKRISRIWRSQKSIIKKLVLTIPGYIEDLFIHAGIRNVHTVINQTEFQQTRLKTVWKKKSGIILPSIYQVDLKQAKAEKENVILWLANLNKGKNPEAFIRLAEKCIDNRDWKFVLVGGTESQNYEQQIRVRIRQLNNIDMAGKIQIDETYQKFSQASIFVNTSQPGSEGLPNTFIQAWMNKTVVVSLHHNPNKWLTEKNLGLFAEGSEDNLFKLVRDLLSKPYLCKEYANLAFDFASEYFNPAKVRDQYLKLF